MMNNDGVWKMWKTILICSYYEVLWIYFYLYHWFVNIKSLFVNELYSFPQLMNVVDKMMWKSRVRECSVQNCCLSGGIYLFFPPIFCYSWMMWKIGGLLLFFPSVIHKFSTILSKSAKSARVCVFITLIQFSQVRYFLLSVWTERRNKKEPRTRSRYRSPGEHPATCRGRFAKRF